MRVSNTKWVNDEKEFHNRLAKGYASICSLDAPYNKATNQKRVDDLKKLIAEFDSPKILEVGCGTGFTLIPLLEDIKNASFYALDISPEMIKIIKDKIMQDNQKLSSPCQLLVADAMKLPFEDDFFQVVYLVATLHHLPELRLALSEYNRVLVKGGILYINDPVNSKFLTLLGRIILRRRPSKDLSPHERSFPIPYILKEARNHFLIEKYEVSNLLATLVGGKQSTKIARLAYYLERILVKIPLLRRLGLSLSLWCRKT